MVHGPVRVKTIFIIQHISFFHCVDICTEMAVKPLDASPSSGTKLTSNSHILHCEGRREEPVLPKNVINKTVQFYTFLIFYDLMVKI